MIWSPAAWGSRTRAAAATTREERVCHRNDHHGRDHLRAVQTSTHLRRLHRFAIREDPDTCQDAEVTVAMRDRASLSPAFNGSWTVTVVLEVPAEIVTEMGSSI